MSGIFALDDLCCKNLSESLSLSCAWIQNNLQLDEKQPSLPLFGSKMPTPPPFLNILLPLKLRRDLSYSFLSLSAPHPSVKIATICFRERSHNMTGSRGLWMGCMAGLSGTGNLGKSCCLELYLYIMAAGPHRLGSSAFCLFTSSIHC